MGQKRIYASAALAAAVIVALGASAVSLWNGVGPERISAAGWAAMILGTVLALSLAVGLVSLMVWSHRQGYDDGPEP